MHKKLRLCVIPLSSLILSSLVGSATQPLPARADGPLPQVYLPFVTKGTFVVYSSRSLWEGAAGGSLNTEDFERDDADYGVLSFPYQTGNGFILDGQSSAQILVDGTLLPSGNILHFRDWASGLIFYFPNTTPVRAFGFDYRPSETWQLNISGAVIILPPGRRGFVGLVILQDFPFYFNLSSNANAQGGLSVDNIAFVSVNSP